MLMIKEHLKRVFTGEELVTIARQQATHHESLREHEDELDQIKQSYKAKMTNEENQIGLCTTKIQRGYEMIDVDCLVLKFRPSKDEKLIVRLDIGRIVKQEKLVAEERQLTITTIQDTFAWVASIADDDGIVIDVQVTDKEAEKLRDLREVTLEPMRKQISEAPPTINDRPTQ